MVKRLLLIACVLVGLAAPASAQNCVVVNGVTTCANTFRYLAPIFIVTSKAGPVVTITRGSLGAITDQAISSTATWLDSGTTYTHWKANVTNTASNSASLLMDLQVGGVSKYSVRVDGLVTLAASAPLVLGAFGRITPQSDGVFTLFNNGTSDFTRLQFGGTTSSFPSLSHSGNQLIARLADDSANAPFQASDISATSALRNTAAAITVGGGTGITVNQTGSAQQMTYKVTVAFGNFIAAAVTADVTLATLPAKTILQYAIADLTTPFVCAGTCTTATLSMTCGKTAGGNEYLVSFDADAAAAQFGDAQAELGAALKTVTPPSTPLGDLPSWAGTTAVQCRMTSGTGNIGTGAATNFNAGSITFYLVTTVMP